MLKHSCQETEPLNLLQLSRFNLSPLPNRPDSFSSFPYHFYFGGTLDSQTVFCPIPYLRTSLLLSLRPATATRPSPDRPNFASDILPLSASSCCSPFPGASHARTLSPRGNCSLQQKSRAYHFDREKLRLWSLLTGPETGPLSASHAHV
jgi:hypothetical protein